VKSVRSFDYVALGHLHGSQQIGEKHIRYSGTPLKYSVSEEKHEKSITLVTLREKRKIS
jgi:exonuclease SbcD